MTDEEFVREWLYRETGTEFRKKYPHDATRVFDLLSKGILPTCDPSEGVGCCSCSLGKLSDGVRFYLSEDWFMMICPRCDSWTIVETARAKRRDRGFA